ncbi:hypothetical protein CAPTEDRAFT_188636 [Capitella teleta]|uniref:Apple domain-containing protein n=1 Tax=Capitella teleta TaxID=283909 RepID=R7UZ27_CAPTE|nr:hypothetical protein CAPTEDRAFT_188636 [Capitella teleta]|eukprot:ELU11828.1 hypothetical protein CAPTEDRAFT_188636 [Capitella teleta]
MSTLFCLQQGDFSTSRPITIKNNSCPILTCPSGYELDSTGTTCNALPTTAAAECATLPTFTCPDGYELDSTGTACNANSDTTAARTECATCPTFTCPLGYDLDASGTNCLVISTADPTSEASTETPTTISSESLTTTPDGLVLAPHDNFVEYNDSFPGPKYVPEGFAAYPGVSVNGGDPLDGAFNWDECLEACNNTCAAMDYTYVGNPVVGACYLFDNSTKCNAPRVNQIGYHMTRLEVCTEYPWDNGTFVPKATNPL